MKVTMYRYCITNVHTFIVTYTQRIIVLVDVVVAMTVGYSRPAYVHMLVVGTLWMWARFLQVLSNCLLLRPCSVLPTLFTCTCGVQPQMLNLAVRCFIIVM
jgi:hypothetical protein